MPSCAYAIGRGLDESIRDSPVMKAGLDEPHVFIVKIILSLRHPEMKGCLS